MDGGERQPAREDQRREQRVQGYYEDMVGRQHPELSSEERRRRASLLRVLEDKLSDQTRPGEQGYREEQARREERKRRRRRALVMMLPPLIVSAGWLQRHGGVDAETVGRVINLAMMLLPVAGIVGALWLRRVVRKWS
jgi:hypothetical protein